MQEEPEYIEDSEEIVLLKKFYGYKELSIQYGHWSLGFNLLTQTLYVMNGNTIFSSLVNNSHLYEESIKFSSNLKKVIEVNKWSESTSNTAFYAMKKILSNTNINSGFLKKISISKTKTIKRNTEEFCMPTKYKKLDDNNITKKIVLDWIKLFKSNTKYKSHSSLRMSIAFIIKLFETLNIKIENNQDFLNLDFDAIKQSILNTNPNFPLKTKINYTMNFMCFVLNDCKYINEFNIYKKSVNVKKDTKEDSDIHRIQKEELELMFEESKKNIRNNCLFLLMITTGLRACGVSNIKINNICTLFNGKITINKSGRTIEKNNKWFTFPISEELNHLLFKYINENRKSNSSYLFPGTGQDIGISTNRINSIIKNIGQQSGLKGKHIHAHSLRHSFAHILLESGNNPDLVSKMLGHTSTKTTEQYYTKESALEVSKRSNIPWLIKQENIDPVPKFLKIIKKQKTSKHERHKILKNLIKDLK